jgi:hypothetical protein
MYRNNDLCDYPHGALSFYPVLVILLERTPVSRLYAAIFELFGQQESPLKKTT